MMHEGLVSVWYANANLSLRHRGYKTAHNNAHLSESRSLLRIPPSRSSRAPLLECLGPSRGLCLPLPKKNGYRSLRTPEDLSNDFGVVTAMDVFVASLSCPKLPVSVRMRDVCRACRWLQGDIAMETSMAGKEMSRFPPNTGCSLG